MIRMKTCTGTGLIALDVIMNGNPSTPAKYHVGGSCGNVLTIMSFLDWESYPIGRLAMNNATSLVVEDFKKWVVNTTFLSIEESGSTPIIIHRILRDKHGNPKHRFEFKDPSSGKWLPTYKALISKKVSELETRLPESSVYYFDRVSRSSIDLAKIYKDRGALIVFEPTSIKDIKQFKECLNFSHIIKFSNDRIRNYKSLFSDIQVPLEIETKGKDGLSYRFRNNYWIDLPAYLIEDVVDAAGAGDWSTAGLIYKLGKKGIESFEKSNLLEIENALKFGQALGAINCYFDGARGIMYNMNLDNLKNAVYRIQENKIITFCEIEKDFIKKDNFCFEWELLLESQESTASR